MEVVPHLLLITVSLLEFLHLLRSISVFNSEKIRNHCFKVLKRTQTINQSLAVDWSSVDEGQIDYLSFSFRSDFFHEELRGLLQ